MRIAKSYLICSRLLKASLIVQGLLDCSRSLRLLKVSDKVCSVSLDRYFLDERVSEYVREWVSERSLILWHCALCLRVSELELHLLGHGSGGREPSSSSHVVVDALRQEEVGVLCGPSKFPWCCRLAGGLQREEHLFR